MGRKAGVTPEQTRSELLAGAARVFARKGYDGSSISEICAEAGLTSGGIYAHFGSKAELFAAVLEANGQDQFAQLLGDGSELTDIGDFVAVTGASYNAHRGDVALLLESIVASKRDPEVSRRVSDQMAATEELLAAAIRDAQDRGIADPTADAQAMARLAMMVALGSALTTSLDLAPVSDDDWADLIRRLVDSLRTEPADSADPT